MKKLVPFLSNKAIFPLYAVLSAALFWYGSYAFWYEFLSWQNLTLVFLNDLLALLGFGAMAVLCFSAKKSIGAKRGLAVFFGAIAVHQAALWVILTVVNKGGLYNRKAIITAYAVLLTAFAVLTVATFARLAKVKYKVFNRIFAAVCAIAFVVVAARPFWRDYKHTLIVLFSKDAQTFDTISAEEIKISDAEKEKCENWFGDNVLCKNGGTPVYGFTLGDKSFPADCTSSPEIKTVSDGVYEVSWQFEGIEICVNASLYKENATCEWTVHLRNGGSENSPEVSDFYAADTVLDVTDPELYYLLGSDNSAEDFTMKKAKLTSLKFDFVPREGRSSCGFSPYFNFSGKNGGAVMAIGWTGTWDMQTCKDKNGVEVKAAQNELKGYLTPGETIRSPLVSLTFYNGNNCVKGFNTFRSFMLDDVIPENTKNITSYVLADEFSTLTVQELIDKMHDPELKFMDAADVVWMDAGWYEYTESWSDGNGNWAADPARYPNGMGEIGDAVNADGKKYLLWYEPERLRAGTLMWQKGEENPDWMIKADDENALWNLANDDACDWLIDFICASLKENNVSVYRQDFNTDPTAMWEKADSELYGGRKGFCENHYVQNLYRYLDALTEKSGVIIDNCASGGRRLDLEMEKRSVPLWRSDYNCDQTHPDLLEATQNMTAGLSAFIPSSGTTYYTGTEYRARTSIMTCGSTNDFYGELIAKYQAERADLLKNYYPIQIGSTGKDEILAYQFGDETSGFAVIYKRAEVKDREFGLKLSGLSSDKEYDVYNYDTPQTVESFTAGSLMANGIAVTLPDEESALIFRYKVR